MALLSAAYVFGYNLHHLSFLLFLPCSPVLVIGYTPGCVCYVKVHLVKMLCALVFWGGYMALWGIFGTQLAPHQLSRLSLLSPAAAHCHRLPAADGLFFDQNTFCTYLIEYRKHTEYRIYGSPSINRKAEKRSTDTQTSYTIVLMKIFADNINKQNV